MLDLPARPDLIIFDCDGVIVDSEPITSEMIRDDLATHGLDLQIEQINSLFVGGTIAGLAARAGEMGARLPPDWVAQFYPRLCLRLAEDTPLIPGILPLLDQLDAAGVPYCVASNGRHAKMDATLGQHAGLARRFTTNRFAAQDVANPKPAPDLFLHAARTMGHASARCIVVEDSPTGARAARAAGIRCVGYAPLFDGIADPGPRLHAEAAHVIRDLMDLPDLLNL